MHSEEAIFEVIEGIPFHLSAWFNRFDKLTDIDLVYVGPDGISTDECMSIFERSVDWVSNNYGPMYGRPMNPKDDPSKFVTRTTPSGLEYELWLDGDSAAPLLMRTAPTDFPLESRSLNINEWNDDQFVYVAAVKVTDMCEVNIKFNDSPSVERPKL